MCTRFVFRGDDVINGFDFDIDLGVWKHKVICERDRFYIGILMPDEHYHSFHGVNQNGNVGTLLYVHGNEAAAYDGGADSCTIADLMERFVRGDITFDEALRLTETKRITYAPGATMQGMLADATGRALIVEPGIGHRLEQTPKPYTLITNYSLLQPESTEAFITPGDDRYERAKSALDGYGPSFDVEDAWTVLKLAHAEGPWATRVSFVYSQRERTVQYVENNDFDHVERFAFGK